MGINVNAANLNRMLSQTKTSASSGAKIKNLKFHLDGQAIKTVKKPTAAFAPNLSESITLSEEALRKMEEAQGWRKEMERAQEAGEAMGESMRQKMKMLMIAMRIMGGDNVPQEDHRALMEYDPELYQRAITMRVQKENPHDYESLLEDEEGGEDGESGGSGGADGGEGAAQVAAGDSGGGGAQVSVE